MSLTVPSAQRHTGPPAPGASRVEDAPWVQGTFEELATPLREVTFVVVDLETTGGSTADCAITEFGAVKVRGGERLGEFQTLVDPGLPIPPFIAVLTGITDAAVAGAPRLGEALPAFLEFARGSVLVAHNAGFDIGFLRAACQAEGYAWPAFPVVDTVRLARGAFTREEAPNCKLATLARVVGATTMPEHRALADARATVDVLHATLERLAGLGVHDLDALLTFSARVSPHQRRKRHLAADIPSAPGVYVFRDASGRVLYVGTSRDLRTRVRSYFTAGETRRRMVEMIALAESVTPIVCPTALEAQVRELRLIAEHCPPYNRRSRYPEKVTWLKLTDEAFPRLSLVRTIRPGEGSYVGPFPSRRVAEQAMAAVHEVFPIRQCTPKLSTHRRVFACILAALGRCGAPCEGRQSPEEYGEVATAVRQTFEQSAGELVGRTRGRLERLASRRRYEEAAASRDRLLAFLRGAAKRQRSAPVIGAREIVAARPTHQGGWEIVLARYGRVAGTAVAPRGTPPRLVATALLATAEVVPEPGSEGAAPALAAHPEETECLLRWLCQEGVRLVELDGEWSSPADGAERYRQEVEKQLAAEVAQAVSPVGS